MKYLKRFMRWFEAHPKAKKITLIGTPVLVVGWLGFIWYTAGNTVVRTDPAAATVSEPAVEFLPSPLTGVNVSPELAKRPVIAAQIENSPEARPQSGLDDAGVIIEAIAEAGITRFTAYYQEAEPPTIGPVRSLRPYFIDWLLGFDAAVVHVGGSTQALKSIPQLGVKSLDTGGAWRRVDDRFAPHNAYSSYNELKEVIKRLGYNKQPKFTPLARKDDAKLESPTAKSVSIGISSETYNISYAYDSGCNCYKRTMAGLPHKDRESGKQLAPKVVIALKIPQRVIDGVGHIGMDTIGSGQGWVFQDGGVTKVTWKKKSRAGQFSFTDAKGNKVELNRGQTWITVIPSDQSVTSKP